MPTLRIVTVVLLYFLARVAFSDKKPEEIKDQRIKFTTSLIANGH